MAIKPFTVTLEENVVEKAKEKSLGAKLSPIINSLLELYVAKQIEVMKMIEDFKQEENSK